MLLGSRKRNSEDSSENYSDGDLNDQNAYYTIRRLNKRVQKEIRKKFEDLQKKTSQNGAAKSEQAVSQALFPQSEPIKDE